MDTKKILILCDLFPPAFGPRMGYLCKYLKALGWTPTVVTEASSDNTFAFLSGNCAVTAVSFYRAKGRIAKRIEWFIFFLLNLFFNYKDRLFYRKAREVAEKEKFNLILCSTYRTFPLGAAMRLARRYNLPLVADLRDIIEQYAGNEYISSSFKTLPFLDRWITAFFKWKSLTRRNKVLRFAGCVTTVSPWHVEVLKKYNPDVELIYNGYDPDIFYPEQIKTEQFVITYTGRLLSLAMRDPSLLFEAVAQLSCEGKISPGDFRIKWYIDNDSEKILLPLVRQYGIMEYMDYPGYIPASEIPALLNRSSVLLQLTNKATGTGPKGLMTTKFFEALAVEKPVLCVRSDEQCLEQAIRETGAGLSARTVEEVKVFLLEKYAEWKQKGYTTVPVKKDIIRKYSRVEQARQFTAIFEELTVPEKRE
ncbi:MAG: glycosyltransferase [Bacteroidales bacterium]|nr:glycosyltransferase [Bacteroidales bacterium]